MACVRLVSPGVYVDSDCSAAGALSISSGSSTAACESPLYLDPQSAVAIGGAMLVCMSVAWVARMARKALETGVQSPESE